MGNWKPIPPSNATPLELAIDYALFHRFETFESDLEAILDPYKTPSKFLPFVAWEQGTTLWEESWAESNKREWAGEQLNFQAHRGTPYAYRRALHSMGFDLVQYVTAPQGFYASPNLSKKYWDDWIKKMPQIRIFYARDTSIASGDEWYVGDGAVGVCAAGRDDGWLYHGRKAVLRQNGVDTPLKTYQFTKNIENRPAFTIDRVSTTGSVSLGFCVGDFVGEDRFIGFAEVEPKLLTIRLDQNYRHEESDLQLTTVTPSLEPLDVSYERDSDFEDAGLSWFVGDGYFNERYCTPDRGGMLLADRMYLHDPEVAVPMNEGISYVGDARVGIEPHTAELLVDLKMKDKEPSFYVDGYIGELFAIAEDKTYSDRAFRAIQAAKSFHDRILVSFEVIRPLTARDTVTQATHAGDWVRNTL